MSDNAVQRRRVVASQPATCSPIPSSSQPRARAKVDLASIATPPPSRPSIRSTISSTSLRSGVSASGGPSRQALASPSFNASSPYTKSTPALTPTHVRSPPVPSFPQRPPSRPEPSKSTPVIRARATPIQRSTTVQTPVRPNANPLSPILPQAGGSNQSVVDRGRAKVKTEMYISTPTLQSRSRSRTRITISPQSSPSLNNDNRSDIGHGYLLDANVAMERTTSNQSSPGHTPYPPHVYPAIDQFVQHPTASCPSSPPRPRQHAKALPINPNTTLIGLFPSTPLSPQMKTISLPIMTPRRMSEASSGSDRPRTSGTGSNQGELEDRRESSKGDSWSGSTAADRNVDGAGVKLFEGDVQEVTEVLVDDAEEAKVNRKIADLEISNASLMAINRSLEATKAKQRSEILKLRRALRESVDGPALHRPLQSPLGLFSPGLEDPDDPLNSDDEDEVDDVEADQRWDKIQELIGSMQRRGEAAVLKGKEEIKIASQRVLDWTQVDGDQSVDEGRGTGAGTPEPEPEAGILES